MFGTNDSFNCIALRFSYSIREFSYNYDEFYALLEAEGLEDFAPRKRTPGEIFGTVSQRLRKIYKVNGLRYETEVKQANETASDTMERVIQVTQIDRKGRKVTDGHKVARLMFNKQTQAFQYITENNRPVLMDEEDLSPIPEFILEDIENITLKITEEKLLVSSKQIRNSVLRIISSVGIPVEGVQSTWTIPKQEEHVIESIKTLADTINHVIGYKVIFYDILPIADNADIRDALNSDAVVYAYKEFESLLLEEQERIEKSKDPVKASTEAGKRFQTKAESVLSIIRKHETIMADAFEKIEDSKHHFQRMLKVFDINIDTAC